MFLSLVTIASLVTCDLLLESLYFILTSSLLLDTHNTDCLPSNSLIEIISGLLNLMLVKLFQERSFLLLHFLGEGALPLVKLIIQTLLNPVFLHVLLTGFHLSSLPVHLFRNLPFVHLLEHPCELPDSLIKQGQELVDLQVQVI